MDKLWSPWRSKYIESFKPGNKEKDECLFCKIPSDNKDKENYLVHRGDKGYIVMNLYPYNSGHLMIVPYEHRGKLSELDDATSLDCMKLLNLGCRILEESIFPQGYNIGTNIGRCSGAGIENHIHFHVVPRWNGDTNFMPVLNEIKVVSELMDETYEKLRKSLEKILQQK